MQRFTPGENQRSEENPRGLSLGKLDKRDGIRDVRMRPLVEKTEEKPEKDEYI